MVESKNRIDELLEDSFRCIRNCFFFENVYCILNRNSHFHIPHRTEFHLKFLWGSKGALASADERHSKLEQVLSLMAEKFCNVQNDSVENLHADQAG